MIQPNFQTRAQTPTDRISVWGEHFLHRTQLVPHPFCRSLYEVCIASTQADGYEMLTEVKTEHNFFRQHKSDMTERTVRRFFRLMSIHHSIRLLQEEPMIPSWTILREALFSVFECEEMEERLADILYQIASLNEAYFADLFAKTAARYLFSCESLSTFSLAFLENFCYNSYNSFRETFTRYGSMGYIINRNEPELMQYKEALP